MLSTMRTVPRRFSNFLVVPRGFNSQDNPPETKKQLKTEVINLYKNLIYLSKDWHTDLKPKIKEAFLKNKSETNPEEIRKLIGRGEYICRELTATYYLKKYRTLKRRYYKENEDEHIDDIIKRISTS